MEIRNNDMMQLVVDFCVANNITRAKLDMEYGNIYGVDSCNLLGIRSCVLALNYTQIIE
jgi:hypothetical protein